MRKKSNPEKIAERRAKRKEKMINETDLNTHLPPQRESTAFYEKDNKKKRKPKKISYSKNRRNRKRVVGKKSFKAYIIVLFIAILILIISILAGNRKEDVSKFFYYNNQKITTKKPIKTSLAQNSTARLAILSLDDIKNIFDPNIRYSKESKEIITIGKTHVARIILNDYAINLNGTDSAINVSAFEEDGVVYIPLNDLSSVYGIEVFVTQTNKVLVDQFHKQKKLVKVLDNTRLKKSKGIFSKTLLKLSGNEDYVLVEEGKNKLKIRTLEGIYGYVPTKKSKSIIEVRSDYIEEEATIYNFIRNYRSPDDNFDKITLKEGSNATIIDLFNISGNKNSIVLSEKHQKDESSYKIFREKLRTENIEVVAELNLEKFLLSKYLENFEKRQNFIYNILKISTNHNLKGIEIKIAKDEDLKIYEDFIEELKPRLKERALMFFEFEQKI